MAKKSVQQKQTGEPQWLVKNEHGETFGPVQFETLKEWARDGRLAPASMVSKDAGAWSPVAHLPELEMDWMAEVSPGMFYGPIHRQALEGLQKDGTIASAAPLFVRSGTPPPTHPSDALSACVEQAEQAQKLLTLQVAQLTAQLAERDARLQRLEQREADFSMLELLTQKIIAAQELGTQQILDAVVDAQAALLADVTQELTRGRQAMLKATSTLTHDVKAGQEQTMIATRDTAAALSQQVQQLADGIQSLEKMLADSAQPASPSVERIYVEAEAVEVIPPPKQRSKSKPPPNDPVTAETVNPDFGVNGTKGLSMAELEQQAQRELERLGAQGVNLFKRKK